MPLKDHLIAYEKPLSYVWATAALLLAYWTWKDYLITPSLDSLLWIGLHCLAALLFFIRVKPIDYSSSMLAYGIALLSVNYYLLYDLSISADSVIATIGKGVTFLGGSLSLIATVSLGKFFGVLPVYRGVQTRWAYRFVRHPIYASYVVLDMGILLIHPSFGNGIIFLVAILLYVLRIRYEEAVLQQSAEYRTYQAQVKFRLIPFLF